MYNSKTFSIRSGSAQICQKQHKPLKIYHHMRSKTNKSHMQMRAFSENGDSSVIHFSDFSSASKSFLAIEEYRLLMQQPEPDLLTGAVLIARHRYPNLELQNIVDVVDDLAQQVQATLPPSPYPLKVINAISDYLYKNRGFKGNSDYYHPDNSCINCVLERRVGIPISLSLVYMEVAKRCGFELYGVNVPGHFYLTPADGDLEFFIDAYDQGKISFIEDAEETLTKIYGKQVKLDKAFLQKGEQIPSRMFLARMLNNLKALYAVKKNYIAAYTINQYLRATRPGDLDEVKEGAFILWHLQRYEECAAMLKEFLERAPSDNDAAPKVRRLLRTLREYDDDDDDDDEQCDV